ncbi:hypothetical protein ACIRON_30495 [Nocardioides sp. NPDC101246]|uniref:hypothetical protein n=1 Tax=Nocardioides sp. NPDC101246 TaxID=3364336 RepID=UPI0038164C02
MNLKKLPSEIREAAGANGRELAVFMLGFPGAFGLVAFALGLIPAVRADPEAPKPAGFFILGAIIGFLVGVAVLGSRVDKRAERLIFEAVRGDIATADAMVAEADDDGFAAIWRATQERLDYYHELGLLQSRRSFAYGLVAAGLGLVAAVVCAVVAARAGSVTGAVTAGGLGAVVSALTCYVGATFMRAYLLASQQLRAYFNQSADSWRYLSAERLVQQIPAGVERDRAIAALAIAVAVRQATSPEDVHAAGQWVN